MSSLTMMRTNFKEERRTFSIIMQVTTFVIFMKTESDAKMVEGCAFSKMTLICNEAKVINISSVVLGDSPGCPDAKCCPKNDSCTTKPNDNHVNEVHRRCNGRLTCTVDVIQEKIPCEKTLWLFKHNNDFERITYDCIDKRRSTTDAFKTTPSTDFHAATTEETSKFTYDGTEPTPIIIAIVCLLVLITIIVLITVIVKRKKSSSKTNTEVEMTNGQNGIHSNQIQDTNGNPNLSSSRQNDGQYCTSTTYEDPNNVVECSVVSQETSPAAEGSGVEYCSIDIKSDSQTPDTNPEDDGYSLTGDHDNRQSTCVENVYEDVESNQSEIKAKYVNIRSDGGAYEEPKNIGGQAVSSGFQLECRPYSKDEKSVSNSKADESIYRNIGEVGTPSSASSPCEPMTSILSQNVSVNESAVPLRTESLTSSSDWHSEVHTPYCKMRSTLVKLKDDGAHMLVDNKLYNH